MTSYGDFGKSTNKRVWFLTGKKNVFFFDRGEKDVKRTTLECLTCEPSSFFYFEVCDFDSRRVNQIFDHSPARADTTYVLRTHKSLRGRIRRTYSEKKKKRTVCTRLKFV